MPSPSPRYRAIAADLEHQIVSGQLKVGQQLPSISELMEKYDVAGLNTVRQAQQLLASRGLIETIQGVGTFVLRSSAEPAPTDVEHELRAARRAIERSIAGLGRATSGMRVRFTATDRPGLIADTYQNDVHLLCRTCGEPITSSRPGIFHVPRGPLPKDVVLAPVHKGICDDDQQASWEEVPALLSALLRGVAEAEYDSADRP